MRSIKAESFIPRFKRVQTALFQTRASYLHVMRAIDNVLKAKRTERESAVLTEVRTRTKEMNDRWEEVIHAFYDGLEGSEKKS